MVNYCKCGCGKIANSLFIRGHSNYRLKNKSYEERFGKVYAKKIRLSQRKIKNVQQVVDVLQEIFKYEGNIMKMEFFNNKTVKKKLGTMNTIRDTLKKENISLDDIANIANVQFKIQNDRIGVHETQLLNNIEVDNNIKLKRQFPVLNFRVDGYDLINNIVYEIDEPHHKYFKIQDTIRENKIKNALGCSVLRIKDGW